MPTPHRRPRAARLLLLAVALLLTACTAAQRTEQKLAQLSGLVGEATAHVQAYEGALADAERLRAAIAEELGAEAAGPLVTVDERVAQAKGGFAEAQRLLAQIGPIPTAPVEPTPALEAQLDAQIATARQAVLAGETYLADFRSIQQMFEQLAEEWVRELLWFEVDGYWVSEEDEFAAYNVCYYGERLSRRSADGQLSEAIISDEQDRGGGGSWFGSDQRGVDWKYFTVDDYIELVNSGIVARAPGTISSDEQAGAYLCGPSPQSGQYGALGEPTVTIEKGYGSMRAELSDEGSSFVGDERYGQWCVENPDGTVRPIPAGEQPPADAQWCWYQQPGGSTGYYYERRPSGSSFIYIQSHRRCIYCAPNSAWSGGEYVPDRVMAATNQTDGAGLRGPADQGGGPGSGK